MHAIQKFHYNRLQECLKKIQVESEDMHLPEDHLNSINQQGIRLRQLLQDYHDALQQLSVLIQQYGKEHQSVQSLIYVHKKHIRKVAKSNKRPANNTLNSPA